MDRQTAMMMATRLAIDIWRSASAVADRRLSTAHLTVDIPISLEPIREVWIHDEAFAAASRLSMMRIMAKRTNAATVVA